MRRFRLTYLGLDQRGGEREIACVDEGEALLRCHAMLATCRRVEAWEGYRLVCRATRPVPRA